MKTGLKCSHAVVTVRHSVVKYHLTTHKYSTITSLLCCTTTQGKCSERPCVTSVPPTLRAATSLTKGRPCRVLDFMALHQSSLLYTSPKFVSITQRTPANFFSLPPSPIFFSHNLPLFVMGNIHILHSNLTNENKKITGIGHFRAILSPAAATAPPSRLSHTFTLVSLYPVLPVQLLRPNHAWQSNPISTWRLSVRGTLIIITY